MVSSFFALKSSLDVLNHVYIVGILSNKARLMHIYIFIDRHASFTLHKSKNYIYFKTYKHCEWAVETINLGR